MMATVYLAPHILFARFIAAPQSQVLWFFATVTGPLTRPVRALLPPGMPERRVRVVALAVVPRPVGRPGPVAAGRRAASAAEPATVLALAGVNAAGMVVFGAVYGAAALGCSPSPPSWPRSSWSSSARWSCWVRVERARAPAAMRSGAARPHRSAASSWPCSPCRAWSSCRSSALQSQLPPEAGLDHVVSRVMVLLLIALAPDRRSSTSSAALGAGAAPPPRRAAEPRRARGHAARRPPWLLAGLSGVRRASTRRRSPDLRAAARVRELPPGAALLVRGRAGARLVRRRGVRIAARESAGARIRVRRAARRAGSGRRARRGLARRRAALVGDGHRGDPLLAGAAGGHRGPARPDPRHPARHIRRRPRRCSQRTSATS